MTAYLIVNFGGPRSLSEIEPFLSALLTDRDVVRTKLPQLFNHYLFRRIAKKRAVKVAVDYESIGGSSPIYSDTEYVADALRKKLKAPVLTFHRYLPSTHADSLAAIENLDVSEIRVFPMFPQFTYATTGSIARFFLNKLSRKTVDTLKWVKSYPSHPAFIAVTQRAIREFLEAHQLDEKEILFFFSAHGLPQDFVDQGDLYSYECRLSYDCVMKGFPKAEALLAYQSKFGPGEWLRPYTQEVCEQIEKYRKGRENVLFIPISFTSDHIETLFEVEQQYIPIVKEQGLFAYRLPALNRRPDWIEAIAEIVTQFTPASTSMLVRNR
ncbi:MAG: ferrochelatase [Chlamydiales bacterium]|nr:ferrochelatase [Chlamydiales bacterium]